jgi:polysaccharide biosynthesis protein PslH
VRVLYATPVLHHPPIGGPTLRVENSIKALAAVAEVHLYCRLPVEKFGGEAALRFYRGVCRSVRLAPFVQRDQGMALLGKRVANKLARLAGGRNVFPLRLGADGENCSDAVAVAKAVRADVVWLGYGNISYSLLRHLKLNSPFPVVLDTDSEWSRFVLRGLPYARTDRERERIEREGRAEEDEERWGAELADVTTAVSEVDAEYYRGLAPRPERVRVFSNVIDLATYASPPPPAPGLQRPALVLAGSFWAGSPMEEAARWIVREVLPRVRADFPGVHLYVIGNGSNEIVKDLASDGVTVTGRVTSVLPYLCHAAATLVPLRFESGTRFKILEAGACRIPVVSTALGAEGLPVEHGRHLWIADDADGFAAAVVEILRNEAAAARVASRLHDLVAKDFTLPRLEREAREILGRMKAEG